MSGKRTISDRFIIADPEHDLLGRGGMGHVYRATDAVTGGTVAVKTLDPDVIRRDPGLLTRFQHEGKALRQLNHPNIVHMVHACEQDGCHYLITEYVDGGSLDELLKREGRLSLAHAVEIALDLADALTRAHRLGIFHRDLKPANILIASDGAPRLADFGIAHMPEASGLTRTGMVIGTVHYLSPEACRGEALDERSDIWSFGVVLFEMLTGCRPFDGPDLMAVLTAILTQPVPDLSRFAAGLPDALIDLVYRMLEKDRQQRIPSVRLVGAELETLLDTRQDAGADMTASNRFSPPTPGLHIVKTNLPVQATAFVGRDQELVELARLLAEPEIRLVTVVGLGGMGKTRLALEISTRSLDRFRDGVYYVPLEALTSAPAIASAVAEAVGLAFHQGDPEQQLLNFFREKQLLLVVDNCEHLLDELGLIGQILAAAPGVKILATSRIRLGLQGEQLYQLAGMELPDCTTCAESLGYAAVKLFVQSARRVRPAFQLTESVLAPVIRVCRLSEGMPLAIILAAAWVELLDPTEIAAELGANADFLATDLRRVDERQRSIRDIFNYSWNLLNAEEQAVLQALSVFRGGFTREAAQAIAHASLRDLMSLTSKSLVYRRPEGRYEMHELLRQYAAEKLAASPEIERAVRHRHYDWHIDFLQSRSRAIYGYDQARVLAELTGEMGNLRAAWDWAVAEGAVANIERAHEAGFGAIYYFKDWRREGEELFARAADAVAGLDDGEPARRRLLYGRLRLAQAELSGYQGRRTNAVELAQQCLDLFDELGAEPEAASARCLLAWINELPSESSETLARQAASTFRRLGIEGGLAQALRLLANILMALSEFDGARSAFAESLELAKKNEYVSLIHAALGEYAIALIKLGEHQQAHELHEELLALSTRTGSPYDAADALYGLGLDAFSAGRLDEAREFWTRSLAMFEKLEAGIDLIINLKDMASLSNQSAQYAEAIRYGEQALRMQEQLGWRRDPLALDVQLGVAYAGLGNYAASRRHLRRALSDAQASQAALAQLWAVQATARLLAAQGEEEYALELFSLVRDCPTNTQLAKNLATAAIADLEQRLSPDLVSAAKARGRARDLDATLVDLLEELSRG